MKTILTSIFLVLVAGVTNAQSPYLNLVVEDVLLSEPAFSEIETSLGATPHTIRLYASIPDDYEIQLMYGSNLFPWSLSSTAPFYQDAAGGPTTLSIDPIVLSIDPSLNYDSWLTIGYENMSGNSLSILPVSGSFLAPFEAGGGILVNDMIGAAISVLALPTSFPPNTADANGQVLLAQLTGSGDFSGCFNFQLRRLNPDGTIYDPPGSATSETTQFLNVCFEKIYPNTDPCLGDFDQNGYVAISDCLLLLGDYGCNSGCTYDITSDDNVNTVDLLVFLGYLGITCP